MEGGSSYDGMVSWARKGGLACVPLQCCQSAVVERSAVESFQPGSESQGGLGWKGP